LGHFAQSWRGNFPKWANGLLEAKDRQKDSITMAKDGYRVAVKDSFSQQARQ
jgi:hypothetical protein